ncbi:hypothetical protein AB4Y32_40175 [Paraburkholderia phymatum]|uniref:Uncharacterized protein n=1 Tax=Paraburkholderia phymatum TaxID=148447 RepID=A0ACC6UDP2_9BURK
MTCLDPIHLGEVSVDISTETGETLPSAQGGLAFQEALGLNPIAYLREVRLNHVRRELRIGESVTSAATMVDTYSIPSKLPLNSGGSVANARSAEKRL